jgi:hypothetical protein
VHGLFLVELSYPALRAPLKKKHPAPLPSPLQ